MKRFLTAFLILFSACSSPVSNSKASIDSSVAATKSRNEGPAKEHSAEEIKKDNLFGAWTDGSTENAMFDIGKDSIFYLNQMTSYPYTLKGDSLTIVYPDMSFVGTAKFSGDTLILSAPEFGTTKYTRFKN
jgi:hypothetical protein